MKLSDVVVITELQRGTVRVTVTPVGPGGVDSLGEGRKYRIPAVLVEV